MAHFEVRGKGSFEVRGNLPPCAFHGVVRSKLPGDVTLLCLTVYLSHSLLHFQKVSENPNLRL